MVTIMEHYHFSEKEAKTLLKSMTVLIDTREQQNAWITDYFTAKGMSFRSFKLNSGDYSVMLPANPELGILRDYYFDRQIFIERKASLEELSQNLAQSRERFVNEFLRSGDCRKFLMVERGNWSDIISGNYQTGFAPNSYFASLLAFQQRYGLNISFVERKHAGQFIYGTLYYFLREKIL
jgi:ERCC4-type nuclease